jgi:GntR family transcriptional regulator, transcriptional repressor for pyruvate dehydrogenase complex
LTGLSGNVACRRHGKLVYPADLNAVNLDDYRSATNGRDESMIGEQREEAADRGLSAFKPVQLRKAADEVLAALIDAIRGGLYRPGDLLPRERDLAEQLEVSRTVVRSAIETLRRAEVLSVQRGRRGGIQVASTNGLVDVLRNMGGQVVSDLRSILEARRTLEVTAALLAARRMTEEDFVELEALVNLLPNRLDEPEAFYEADIQFHLAIAKRSSSEVIADFLGNVFTRLAQIRAQYPYAHVTLVDALDNQRDLLSALRSRDEPRILRAIDEHLQAFETVMIGQPLDLNPS